MSEHPKMVQLIYQLVKAAKTEYTPTGVFKEQKITALLEKQKIRYEPDVHALANNDKIDVYEVLLGETWDESYYRFASCFMVRKLAFFRMD